MDRRVGRCLLALDGVAVLLAGLLVAVATGAAGSRPVSAPVLVGVALLFALAEAFPIDVEIREQGHTLAFTAVPLVVGLCLLPPLLVVGLRVATSVLVLGAIQRQHPLKLATNVASHALQVAVAAAILVPFVPAAPGRPAAWAVAVAAVLAAELAGTALVTGAITLSEGEFDRSYLDGTATGLALLLPDAALGLLAAWLLAARPVEVALLAVVGVALAVAVRAGATVAARYRVLAVLESFTAALGQAVVDDRLRPTLLGELAERLHAGTAWMEDDTDPEQRLALRRGAATLVAQPLAAAEPLEDPSAIEGQVVVGATTLRIGVADRLGAVRGFDHEDVRLFELLVAHAGVALQNVALVDRLRDEARRNEVLATTDALTGLPNRTRFLQELEERPTGEGTTVLLVGLDRFKEVNETLGHQQGDEVLGIVADRLRAAAGEGVACARLGGDQFAIRLATSDEAEARVRAEALIADLGGLCTIGAMDVDVSVTGGLACATTGDGHPAEAVRLVRRADVAMHLAKAARRPLEVYAADRDTANPARLAMAGRLRTAIEDGELELAFQPQVSLRDGRVVGVESLVRWTPAGAAHPVPPIEFVDVAERTGLIHPLTRLVLRRAAEQARTWHDEGLDLRVAVNLSARNLEDPTLVPDLARILDEHGVAPHRFEVEVTETSVMHDPAAALDVLEQIHDLGVAISLDDFCTGHSSLAYVARLPVDQLKVDRSFVLGLSSPTGPGVVHAIVDLGAHLGLEVVAEGLETEEQVDALASMGCTLGQGYYFARPLPGEELGRWLRARQTERRGTLVAL